MREEETPKVSVCVVTYNQEKYIRQCLQSIVDQETNFDFEVIVGDDCSTDGTRAIVLEFADKYPKIVKPVFHEKNIGASQNYLSVHKLAKGEYVAHVDGDDYCLPDKLKKQVNILNNNPDISISAHAVKLENSNQIIGGENNLPEIGTMEDLIILGTYFVHSSVMYRKINQVDYDKKEIVDYYVYIEHASKGNINLNKEPLGVYRKHPEGISQRKDLMEVIEDCYELAFLRAIKLGVSLALIKKGRLIRRKSFAIKRLLQKDKIGFKRKIYLSINEMRYASFKHKALFFLSLVPMGYIVILILIKLKTKNSD